VDAERLREEHESTAGRIASLARQVDALAG